MKMLMELLDRPYDEPPSAWVQAAGAIAGGLSLALFFATIHMQAM